MKRLISICCTAVVLADLAVGASQAAERHDPVDDYFGHILAPCAAAESDNSCDTLIRNVKALGKACPGIDEDCPEGVNIRKELFGSTYRQHLADFIIYLEQKPKHSFVAHRPALVWKGKNTAHLRGVRNVHVLVFSEHRVELEAGITADYEHDPNPLVAILKAVGAPDITAAAPAKSTDSASAPIRWYPVRGNHHPVKVKGNNPDPLLWYGVARLKVDTHTINRLTVRYQQPGEVKPDGTPKIADKTVAQEIGNYKGSFLAYTGHFSNSSASRAGVSVALGSTFNTEGTSLASGGSDQDFNGYVFAKGYIFQPYLRADNNSSGYAPSFGLALGTNVKDKVFDEIVAGFAFGHLLGNVGLILGANYIASADPKPAEEGAPDPAPAVTPPDGRKTRLFLGLDYSF